MAETFVGTFGPEGERHRKHWNTVAPRGEWITFTLTGELPPGTEIRVRRSSYRGSKLEFDLPMQMTAQLDKRDE